MIKVRRGEVAGLFARLRRIRVEEPERLAAMQAVGRAVYERFEGVGCFRGQLCRRVTVLTLRHPVCHHQQASFGTRKRRPPLGRASAGGASQLGGSALLDTQVA